MNSDLIEVLSYLGYLIPALVVGAISYYFFKTHTAHLQRMQHYEIQSKIKKESIPQRLQAYERLVLFLERISPGSLIPRVKPYSDNKNDYENLLIQTIEQEFEHNLTQQIFVSDACWRAVKASKNATITLIRNISMKESIKDAHKLREEILSELLDKETPSQTGIAFLKNGVAQLLQ
ncbi:MAG: hypothetical protein R6V37_08230 [Psychroflexus maritimus]